MTDSNVNQDVQVERLIVGPLESCCYLVWSEQERQAIVIDPGGDPEDIIAKLEEYDLSPAWIVNTHGHGDHIGGNGELKKRWPEARVAVHEADAPMLTSALKNLSVAFGMGIKSPGADVILHEGDTVETDALSLDVRHTPGHTRGGITLVLRTEPMHVFCGDTLFAGAVGRTDFQGGNAEQLERSIRNQIFSLPDDAIVHPGHPPNTTVGREKRTNPFFT